MTAGFKVIIISLNLLFFFSEPAVKAGDTLFVDPDAITKLEEGSKKAPFHSIGKVPWKDNLVVLVKRGTTHKSSPVEINNPGVVISAYGSGSLPVVAAFVNSNKAVITILSSNVMVSKLNIDATGMLAGVFVNGDDNNHIQIEGCEIKGGFNGIRIIGNSYGHRVTNNKISKTQDDGIYAKHIRSLVIVGNKIFNVNQNWFRNKDEKFSSGDCIQIDSKNKLYFELSNNDLDHSSTGNKFCFIVSGDNYSGVISGNFMTGNMAGNTSVIYLHPTKNLVAIRYNKIRGGAFGVYSYAKKLLVYYNIFEDNEIVFSSRVNGHSAFYNNVFNNNLAIFENDLADKITVYNNIFIPAKGSHYLCRQLKNLKEDYNCFAMGDKAAITDKMNAGQYFTSGRPGRHSISGAPGFKTPYTADYQLAPGSACIDKGRKLKISKDYYGVAVPAGKAPDIGIAEFVRAGRK